MNRTESKNENRPQAPLTMRQFGRRVVVTLLITIIIAGLTVFIGFSIDTWFAVYLGILLAIFIRTLSDLLSRHTRLPEKWSVVVILLALLGLAALAAWWLTKPLTQEVAQLQQQLPQAINHLKEKLSSSGLDQFLPSNVSNAKIMDATSSVASTAVSLFSGTLQSAVVVLVVIFIGVYVAFSPAVYLNGLVALFPIRRRDRARAILSETGVKLRYWIFGQLISMTAVGGMIALGLYFSGIPLPIVIGFIAGLLDIVPIFGPIIAAAPAILLGFTVGPWHALYAVGVFVAANQIEQHLLIPIIQRYSIALPPALTVSALLIMGSVFGFWGMLLAAPTVATLLVLVKHIYVEDILGDKGGQKSSG